MADHVQEIDCHAAMTRLWDYLDGELTSQRMAEVQAHLATCVHCLPHGQFAQRLLDVLGSQREQGAVCETLRPRVLRCLAEAGFTPRLT